MALKNCALCDGTIEDNGKEVEVDGKTITVCCDDWATRVLSNPEDYGNRTRAHRLGA